LILTNKDGISFFQFPNLALFSDVWHGIFTRKNGHSKKPYRSLNTSYSNGDDSRNVKLNRQVISKCIDNNELTFARQVHGTKVLVVTKKNFTSKKRLSKNLPEGDAMITDIRNRFLVVQVADCQSVFLYDPDRQVVANVHSGWRGSINNIIGRTIRVMEKEFGSSPENIIAGISPSLGPCCAEFANYKKEIPQNFWEYKDDLNRFDFWAISCKQLCDSGVLEENIFSSKMCTRCNTDLFFSYRGEGATGRFAAVIGLKPKT